MSIKSFLVSFEMVKQLSSPTTPKALNLSNKSAVMSNFVIFLSSNYSINICFLSIL